MYLYGLNKNKLKSISSSPPGLLANQSQELERYEDEYENDLLPLHKFTNLYPYNSSSYPSDALRWQSEPGVFEDGCKGGKEEG